MEEKQLIDILWILIAAGLVFMMQGGFLCLESGLTRSKNSINVAIKNLADFWDRCCSILDIWFCADVRYHQWWMGWNNTFFT